MKSIFDGWEKQIVHSLMDGRGGFCARGWIFHHFGKPEWLWSHYHPDVMAAEKRIGDWIEANLPVPDLYRTLPGAAIAWANNNGVLDIEGFKMVDLLTRGYTPEETPEKITEPDQPGPDDVPIEITEPPVLEPVA